MISCGDSETLNEDTVFKPQYKPEAAIINFGGYRLSGIKGQTIEYGDSFIESIKDENPQSGSAYSSQKILFNYPDGEFHIICYHSPDNSFHGILKLNERGFVSHLEKYSYVVSSGHTYASSTTDTIQIDFMYNDKGYLTEYTTLKKKLDQHWSSHPDLDPYSYDECITITRSVLNWEWARLSNMSVTGTYFENMEKIGEIEKYYSYSDDLQINTYCQYPLFFARAFLSLDYPLNILATMGLFGKGPGTLPTEIKLQDRSYNNNGDTNEKKIGRVEYTLNENGSIETETVKEVDDLTYPLSLKYLFPRLFTYSYSKKF